MCIGSLAIETHLSITYTGIKSLVHNNMCFYSSPSDQVVVCIVEERVITSLLDSGSSVKE